MNNSPLYYLSIVATIFLAVGCDETNNIDDSTSDPTLNCIETEHLFAGKCEADDSNHCGTHTNDCTKMSGWRSGKCIFKNCYAEECETGYHLAILFDSNNEEKTICEEDTHDACGSVNHQCGSQEICTKGECKDTCLPGEVICDGSCINPNTSAKFCGADASCSSFIPCSEFETCIDRQCVLSMCQNAEESLCIEEVQNICVNIHGNNPNHCGACGAVCFDKETVKASGCIQGQCIYTCNDGMINCGSDTEPMCLSEERLKSDALHCGTCDTKCADNEFCLEGTCSVSACAGNECLMNNVCINQNEHCGTQCLNCNTTNHAMTGICSNGTCEITSCINGYHLTVEGSCEIDSATACPNGSTTDTFNCNTLDFTKAGVCEEGICKATECQDNAHIRDDRCVADTLETCGSENNDCNKLAGWETGKCELGKCVATRCQSGFCLNTLQGQCTNDQNGTTCGIDGSACQSCSIKEVCSAGACVAQKCDINICQLPMGANEEDLCQNDDTHCGSNCLNCNTFTSQVTAGTCSNNGTCQVMACKAGFHIYNNACEIDSTTNCGNHGNQCDVANAMNTCMNGECGFTCNAGYHMYNNACEANSVTNCGNHGNQCNVANATNTCSDGICAFTCNTGYHRYNNSCEADSATNCGKHGNQCNVANAMNTCMNGECGFTCNAGYHMYNNACEANSVTNCGNHGNQCNVANATNTCSDGICAFTCNTGYHMYNNACEADSITNCGKHGNQCNVANATNTCADGKCAFACNAGYHRYNNSCEADSVTNCGKHGTQCPNVANATNTCMNGECVFTCNTGYHSNGNVCESDNFVSIWNVTSANDLTVRFPTQENSGNLRIDWGDGEIDNYVSASSEFVYHTYSKASQYTITVQGNINNWSCSTDSTKCVTSYCNQLVVIHSYGNTIFGKYAFCKADQLERLSTQGTPRFKNNMMTGAFQGASKFNQNINFWDTSNITNMSYMFSDAEAFNQPLNDWNTSKVTNMSYMFSGAKAFNQPLSDWDTSNVTTMGMMFQNANAFNQTINSWNTSKLTSMYGMFKGAISFNQPMYGWNTSNVKEMASLFEGCTHFNRPLDTWNTSNVTSMSNMFSGASAFNQPLNNWDTSKVTNMSKMFMNTGFNQPLNNWNTSNVTNMAGMFQEASKFNQILYNWDTSNVANMSKMFKDAKAYNQYLNYWNTSNVTNMEEMFMGAKVYNQALNNWNTSNVRVMASMFNGASKFNQPLNDWNTSNVIDMSGMFKDAKAFNQPLDNWDVSKVEHMSYNYFDNKAKMFEDSGLKKENYCILFTSLYLSIWTKFKKELGISYDCP